jgi:TRAP-type C4-dicarboxylate transport system permease small subunit
MVHGLDAVETEGLTVSAADAAGPFERILTRINQLIVIVSSVALVAAACVLTYSVVSRYFLHFSTDWQDELSVFLIVGAVFMSAAAIQERRGHVAIEAIVGLLPARVNFVRQWLVDVASLVFCGYFAWKSWTLLDESWVENYHSGSTWGPPLWIPYSLMTVGMTLLSLQLLLQVAKPLWRPKPLRRRAAP